MSANYLLDQVVLENTSLLALTKACNDFTANYYEQGGKQEKHPTEDCSIAEDGSLVIKLESLEPSISKTITIPNGSWAWSLPKIEAYD